ncbi:MAG: hypothetical protein EBV89_12645, partial [Betaproteobacteria bacterium]|nr:hypothetical protein [Betaproteobacteria bacterium]
LGVHLGMTGRLSAKSAAHLPSKHDHLILYTSRHALVFEDPRLFGRIRFDRSPQPPPWWSTLPPDLFSRDFSARRLKQILQKRSRTPLKPLLLFAKLRLLALKKLLLPLLLFKARSRFLG